MIFLSLNSITLFQGCRLFNRIWKPSNARFEKLPNISKIIFFPFPFICPPYLYFFSFCLFLPFLLFSPFEKLPNLFWICFSGWGGDGGIRNFLQPYIIFFQWWWFFFQSQSGGVYPVLVHWAQILPQHVLRWRGSRSRQNKVAEESHNN